MGVLSLEERKKNRCTFYVGFQHGRLSKFCSEKVVGALIGVVALKGIHKGIILLVIKESND